MTSETVVFEVPSLDGLTFAGRAELVQMLRAWGDLRKFADAGIAKISAAIAAESAREQGKAGLAQTSGMRSAEIVVSQVTGVSEAEAHAMTQVGALLAKPSSWLDEVASAVENGTLSVGGAAAILRGLGEPSEAVNPEDLANAAHDLLETSGSLPPAKIAKAARDERDQLDPDEVGDRERAQLDKRFLRLTPQADGMTRINGLLAPEGAALVADGFDCVTSPRRGGPRFVDEKTRTRAQAIIDDPRTTEQLMADAFVEMIRIAATADTGKVFGTRKPSVRIHATAADYAYNSGAAHVEGQTSSVSMTTVERIVCTEGALVVEFDNNGDPLRLGHTDTARLFTSKQKDVLAAVWGGCAHPDCDRPPSWCESHHILEWEADHGPTDIENGILLCRFHHLWLHDHRLKIVRRAAADGSGDEYLIAPAVGDTVHDEPVVLVPKNPVHRRQRGRR